MASWRPPEGSWAPGGSHLAVKVVRKLNLGGSWVRLGRSWWLLGRSGGLPGRSWGLLGRSWSLLGRSWGPFWPPGSHFLEPFGPLFGEPMQNGENLEIRLQYGTF